MKLHQLKFSCGDAKSRSFDIGTKFGFQVEEQGNGWEYLARRGRVALLFSQVDGLRRDTLSEIVFHVEDLEPIISRAEANGADMTRAINESIVTIACPVGNLLLTFSQCVECQCLKSELSGIFTHVDHITLAVEYGTSSRLLNWFEKCLNFSRFRMNSLELDDGFSIYSSDTGLRLLALQYWFCNEVGVKPGESIGSCNVKFVIAEPLTGRGSNQVATFLEEHGGPGVQHVGLASSNIIEAMDVLRGLGVQFIQPPDEYYEPVLNENFTIPAQVSPPGRPLETPGLGEKNL
jgi:4-hydroxyphenylpyruvate dioxygenase-like putative hemolysin